MQTTIPIKNYRIKGDKILRKKFWILDFVVVAIIFNEIFVMKFCFFLILVINLTSHQKSNLGFKLLSIVYININIKTMKINFTY